ncbi:signal recognition particle receptor subunit alpha homolog [Artemia franciscana]|uniref:SRP54-type proteins GTP-binding domain-containing protein n=1 Tax=Artemia franciscana TaxID=6661 RepID=A0AA88IEI4_ARTSF|nr:hypothetical protein QYM36_007470 [Artemia franciscana]
MLDFFAIFSRSGVVLWCFQSFGNALTSHINAFINAEIAKGRIGSLSFVNDDTQMKLRLDNEFDLVFVAGFQKILKLMYVDKLLDDVHLEFRDKYKGSLMDKNLFGPFDFEANFSRALKQSEEWEKNESAKAKRMRSFEESAKSKKTVASIMEKKSDVDNQKKKPAKKVQEVDKPFENLACEANGTIDPSEFAMFERKKPTAMRKGAHPKSPKSQEALSPKGSNKKGKTATTWDLSGTSKDTPSLDYGKDGPKDIIVGESEFLPDRNAIGSLRGEVPDMLPDGDDDFDAPKEKKQVKKSQGMFSLFKGLVGGKAVTQQSLQPVLEKLQEHLTSKNVASSIAIEICESVANSLEGKSLGTFETLSSVVKAALKESLTKILSPRRRVNVLRDVADAKSKNKPYVITFCGVNGVGKSTNLAKICFWLLENEFSVLIAACDTFRAGAVEQLKTHVHHLCAVHPSNEIHKKKYGRDIVQLYDRGYGKDAAGIAAEAINFARDTRRDVVLVDTAGRMQDNEPLMRALAKLITVNEPDLVLFVGEALVGNEAVDQLVKFNQALSDFSPAKEPHLVDGIVLTKFDTIDDKVGAAISMTYITGQPIVFVGTGQTYVDLKNLNVPAVVEALMK